MAHIPEMKWLYIFHWSLWNISVHLYIQNNSVLLCYGNSCHPRICDPYTPKLAGSFPKSEQKKKLYFSHTACLPLQDVIYEKPQTYIKTKDRPGHSFTCGTRATRSVGPTEPHRVQTFPDATRPLQSLCWDISVHLWDVSLERRLRTMKSMPVLWRCCRRSLSHAERVFFRILAC